MSRKRRIFDIDVPPVDDMEVGKVPAKALRRGPMASAISENAESLRDRRTTEQSIVEENQKLAQEFVRLKREGMVVDRIPLDMVVSERLVRDRKAGPDEELAELKTSIREVGLSNPIRVEALGDGRFELVQGMRRLQAFRELLAETGDEGFKTIPAGIGSVDQPEASYRRMVDENLIRKDISFAEMATLARNYAADPANGCDGVDQAVAVLFKSASYTKRSYIRAFAGLLTQLEKSLAFPQDIPRNVGVELKRKIDAEPQLGSAVTSALLSEPGRDAAREVAILRGFLGDVAEPKTLPVGKVAETGGAKPRKAKTTFQVQRGGDVAKCNASQGRLELRYDRDFTMIDRRDLERAVAAFFDALDNEG